MLDPAERKLLEDIRRWDDPGPPRWRETWWNWILLLGGVAMVVGSGLETGRFTGAVGGFMIGVALLALVIAVPLSRRLRTLFRLVRHADALQAFAGEEGDEVRTEAAKAAMARMEKDG